MLFILMLTKTPRSSNAWQKRNYYDLVFWFEIITIKAKTKISFRLQVPAVPQTEGSSQQISKRTFRVRAERGTRVWGEEGVRLGPPHLLGAKSREEPLLPK